MHNKPTSIWLPPSHQFREVAQVRQRVKEYDANLDFGLNEETNQWCIFLRHGTMEAATEGDFPILGFRGIPTPDEAVHKLWQTDAVRRGRKVLDDIDAHNDRIRKENEKRHQEVDAQVAEVAEWGFRHVDSPKNPNRKYFFKSKDE